MAVSCGQPSSIRRVARCRSMSCLAASAIASLGSKPARTSSSARQCSTFSISVSGAKSTSTAAIHSVFGESARPDLPRRPRLRQAPAGDPGNRPLDDPVPRAPRPGRPRLASGGRPRLCEARRPSRGTRPTCDGRGGRGVLRALRALPGARGGVRAGRLAQGDGRRAAGAAGRVAAFSRSDRLVAAG